jgi:hypothetical protein
MTYGDGSVYQRHLPTCPPKNKDGTRPAHKCAGRWVAALETGVTERGSRRRITITGRSRSEVTRKRNRRRAELERAEGTATAPDATRKTVHSWGDDWLKLRVQQVKPSTYNTSRSAVRNYIDPAIGRKRLVDLAARDIRTIETKARQRGGESNVKAIRTALMTMLHDAVAEGYAVPTSLFDASKTRRPPVRPKREALPLPQAVAVLAEAANDPHYARWVAGFYQGTRQGETLGFTWDEGVDMDRGLVTLMWQLQPLPYLDKRDRTAGFRVPLGFEARRLEGRFHLVRPKTAAGWRVTPMTEDFHAALTAWREVWPENEHGLIWARTNGWPIDKAADAEAFRALQVAANVHKPDGSLYTGHEMRNTCATILTVSGVDPATITAILGHSSWSTSLGYVTSQLDHMRAALKNVNAAYAPKEIG